MCATLTLTYALRCDFLHRELIVRTHQVFFRSAHRALRAAADALAFRSLLVFPVDAIVLPRLTHVCPTFQIFTSGELEEEMENPEMVNLPEKQKHQLRHRELFLSRQLESLPATHIRYASQSSFLGVASTSGRLRRAVSVLRSGFAHWCNTPRR